MGGKELLCCIHFRSVNQRRKYGLHFLVRAAAGCYIISNFRGIVER